MKNSNLLSVCIECGAPVSVEASSCPACGECPNGIECKICQIKMAIGEVTEISIPTRPGYSHRVTAHKLCWDKLLDDLFPVIHPQASCPACSTPHPEPVATRVRFPSKWICSKCGHPCSLEIDEIGRCNTCALPILNRLHDYWLVQQEPYDDWWEPAPLRALHHRRCGQPTQGKGFRWTLRKIVNGQYRSNRQSVKRRHDESMIERLEKTKKIETGYFLEALKKANEANKNANRALLEGGGPMDVIIAFLKVPVAAVRSMISLPSRISRWLKEK